MRRTFSWVTIAAFVLAICFGAVLGGVAVAANQVHMRNARTDLQAALNQLELATHDKAGYRANAVNLVNQAINQVNMGIQAGAY